jgi:outer membrane biosynthesis protein TonB
MRAIKPKPKPKPKPEPKLQPKAKSQKPKAKRQKTKDKHKTQNTKPKTENENEKKSHAVQNRSRSGPFVGVLEKPPKTDRPTDRHSIVWTLICSDTNGRERALSIVVTSSHERSRESSIDRCYVFSSRSN